MGKLMTSAATMQCGHGIPIAPMPNLMSTKVFVEGNPVLLGTGPFTVSGCPNMPTQAQPSNVPCTTLAFTPMAKMVLVEGKPPLMQDDQSQLNCSPPGNASISPITSKVEAK